MGETVRLKSEEDTVAFAARLVNDLKNLQAFSRGISIGLIGDLGAGKTTFTRAFVKALGCKTPVSSPSYVLQHEYEGEDGLVIEHWDLYRLKGKEAETYPDELFDSPGEGCIRIIEWVDVAPDVLEPGDFILHLAIEDETGRQVTIRRKPFGSSEPVG